MDNCNLSVPDNRHSARPKMIKKAPRLKAMPPRTGEGVASCVLRVLRRSIYVVSNSNSSSQVVMATKMLKQQSVECT